MPLTCDEFEHHGCTQIELTSCDLTWDPSTDIYEDQDNAMMDFQGDIVRPVIIDRGTIMVINSVTFSTCIYAADVLSDDNVVNVLQSNVNFSHFKVLNTQTSVPGCTAVNPLNNTMLFLRWMKMVQVLSCLSS